MANALESASLVMIPSGYEDGTLGSLKPLDGTGDFTFSRGSNTSATRVNADGYIEKGYENLLLQSNTFNTTWTTTRASISGGQTDYNGGNDAWLLNSTDASSSFVLQSINVSGVKTISIYAKANTANWILMYSAGGSIDSWFDIQNGELGSKGAGAISTHIESVGNEWYRCSVSLTNNISDFRVYVSNGNNSFLSDIGDSVYIQDAMLNQGLVAYPYIETTTAPVAGGILEDMPRLDYSNGSCPALLLEPQRTNLVTHSEYFNAWSKTISVVTNTDETKDPSGYYVASKLLETTSSTEQWIYQSASLSGVQTFSVYAKAAGRDYIALSTAGAPRSYFNLFNGSIVSTASGVTSSIESAGNGWYRCSVTSSSVTSGFSIIWISDNGIRHNYAGDNTKGVYVFAAQAEEGSYPTSYIPTYGVSQTRLKDVFDSNADLSTYFGNGQGTFYFEFADQPFKYLSSNETINLGLRDGDYQLGLLGRSTLQFFSFSNFPTTNQPINNVTGGIAAARKYLLKWNGSEVRCYVNGEFQFEFSYSIDFQPNNFGRYGSGYNNTFGELFSQMLFFPTALTDSECIELTTI